MELKDATFWYVKFEEIFEISNEEVDMVNEQINKHNAIVKKVFGK